MTKSIKSINIPLIKSIINNIKQNKELYKHFNFSYRTQKYRLEDTLPIILDVLKYGFSWRYTTKLDKNKFKSNTHYILLKTKIKTNIKNIAWITIYKIYVKLNDYNIFESTYKELLKKYIKKNKNKNFQYILTDTTTIYNKYNTDTAKRNKYFKNKNVIKISVITDQNGIPISIYVCSGNDHDSKIVQMQLNKPFLIDNYLETINKSYFLADKGYDSNILRDTLIDLKYTPIISYNNRNTKNQQLIKKLTIEENNIYKKRIKVENLFGKLKMHYNRITVVNEKKIVNYTGFLHLAMCDIIIKEL